MAEIVGPAWAFGCAECKFGLALSAPIPRTSMSLFEIRRVQAREEVTAFCDCQAGQARKRWTFAEPTPEQPAPVRASRPQAPRTHIHDLTPEQAEELSEVYA